MTTSRKPKPFTLRHLIECTDLGVVEVRGVSWVTDRYVLARGDLFGRPPRPRGLLLPLRSVAVARVLRGVNRTDPELVDAKAEVTDDRVVGRLFVGDSGYVALNAKVAARWLSRPWESIRLGPCPGGPVTFYELRRGCPVLAGLIMPIRLDGARTLQLRAVDEDAG